MVKNKLADFNSQVHEACMLAVSCVVEAVKTQRVHFDCQTFTERILLPDMSVGGT